MLFWIANLAALAAAYLLGSIPTAYLAGRLLKGVDLRERGSKSLGATNALRTLGTGPGLAVLLIDLLKGAAAIAFVRWLFPYLSTLPSLRPLTSLEFLIWTPWAVCLGGLAVVFGHARSVWVGFAGGKSAATGLGVLLAMSWTVGVGAAAVFVATVAVFRFVSLGSMLGAATAIVLIWALPHPPPYRLLVVLGGVYVVVRHRANIARLLAGTEPRLGRPQG